MYTIKQAALRTGVTVPLLRAWERRYGVIRPARTTSGYRLYDEAAIERLRAMRNLVDAGWTPSEAARHLASQPAARAAGEPAGPALGPSSASPVVARTAHPSPSLPSAFVEAAAAFDGRRVERLLDDLFAAGSFERVVDDGLVPVLRALGEGWATGAVTVAAEHAASNAVLRRLSAMFEAAGDGAGDRPVLVGLPPGSRHELGVLAFATAVRRLGIAVLYLGADVPTDSWTDAARAAHAGAAVIGVATGADREAAGEVARAIRRAAPGVLVAVGGGAAASVAAETGALALPAGIAEAARTLDGVLRPRSA